MTSHRLTAPLAALVSCAFVAAVSPAAAQNSSRTYAGSAVEVGKGTARVVVAANAAGEATSVGVALSGTALQGLPPGQHEVEYVLPFPKEGPRTGYDHVGLNWNPAGHEPPGIYSVPHFDVHFYLISRAEREAITFAGPRAEDAKIRPAESIVPKGYAVIPETAIEHMGVHGVNPKAPEFRGKPFTETFIYGYHKGKLIFVEPMVTKAFLESQRDVSIPVQVPDAYSVAAQYPTRYRIGYDAERDQHVIALTRLKPWQGQTAYLTPQAAPMAFQAAVKPLSE